MIHGLAEKDSEDLKKSVSDIFSQLGEKPIFSIPCRVDGFTYNLRKDRKTSSTITWRCSTDESLTAGPKEHNHLANAPDEEKKNLIISLKRKAEDQQLTSKQNILTETLSICTPELNVTLPMLESLARVSQRAIAKL
ncbi:hypothetical protein ACHWQZ_G010882 [Mnemiopsis leidyi]